MSDEAPAVGPRSPRDYRLVARELLRRRDEITAAIKARDDEANVADRDQADAAAREAQAASAETISALGAAGIEVRQLSSDLDERSLAWRLAVAGAISRRIPAHRQCPHAKPGARRPLVALLSPVCSFAVIADSTSLGSSG